MPGFPDGQDPRDATEGRSVYQQTAPQEPPFTVPPSPDEVMGAAFRQNNPVASVVSAINRSRPDQTPVPGYTAVTALLGTKYENLIGQSLGDVNPAQTQARIAQADQEEKDRATLSDSGFAGQVASLAAGLTDPSWLIPIGGELSAVGKGLSIGTRIARGATEGFARSAVSESALMGSQVTRTPQEAAANIASNTILMGLLGGAHGFLTQAERKSAADGLDATRRDFAPPLDETPKPQTVQQALDGWRQRFGIDLPVAAGQGPDLEHMTAGATYREREPGTGNTKLGATSADGYKIRINPDLTPQAQIALASHEFGHVIEYNYYREMSDAEKTPLLKAYLGDTSAAYRQLSPEERATFLRGQRGNALNDAVNEHRGSVGLGDQPVSHGVIEYSREFKEWFANQVSKFLMGGEAHQEVASFMHGLEDKAGYVPPSPAPSPAAPAMAGNLSAAASERRDMKLSPILPEEVRNVIGAVPGGEKALDWMRQIAFSASPTGRTFLNGSPDGKRFLGDMAETSLKFTQAAMGVIASTAGTIPIDRLVKMDRIRYTQSTRAATQNAYVKYLKMQGETFAKQKAIFRGLIGPGDGKLNFAEFKKQVYLARTMKDTHPTIPEATEAAQQIRREITDPVMKLAQSIKGPDGKPMLSDELSPPAGDRSWAERIWNQVAVRARPREFVRIVEDWLSQEQDRHANIKERLNALRDEYKTVSEGGPRKAEIRTEMEDHIKRWGGNTTDGALAALKKREKVFAEGEGGKMAAAGSAADKAVDSAIDDIINKAVTDRTPQEIHSLANEIRHRIDVSPTGRLPYDEPSGGHDMGGPTNARHQPRGSLNARDFAIPTKDVLDFIHTDVEHTIPAYLRSVLPELRFTQRFGDIGATEQYKKIDNWYDQAIDNASSEAEVGRLQKQRDAELRDIDATHKRILGTYGLPTTSTQRNVGRLARAVGNWNVGAFLGTSVINRFQDMANATARRGFMGYMRDGFIPFISGLARIDAGSAAQREAIKAAGVGIDTNMGHYASTFWDMVEDHQPGNRVERGLRASAGAAMFITGHAPWTDANKQIAGMAASKHFLEMAEGIKNGTASERDIRTMAHAGIDPHMATRISNEFENGGHTVVGAEKVPNPGDWKDQNAARMFEAAIQKDADIAVITPGAEKSLFLSDPVLSMLGQFKGFSIAAQERILLSNLQEADGRTLQGFFHMLAMGVLSYRAYTLAAGTEFSTRPQDILKEAVSRAGMLGWMTDANQMQAKFFGGRTDVWNLVGADHPISRTAALSAPEQLLGPTYTLISGLSHAATDASFHAWNAQDTHRIRQAMFLQNLMGFRRLIDAAEDGFNEYIGVQPMNRDHTTWPGGPNP